MGVKCLNLHVCGGGMSCKWECHSGNHGYVINIGQLQYLVFHFLMIIAPYRNTIKTI